MKKSNFRVFYVFMDIVILAISFFIVVSIKPNAIIKSYVASHDSFFAVLAVIWIAVSILNGKLNRGEVVNYAVLIRKVLASNIISIAITALLMYSIRDYTFSRTIVLGTAILATVLEIISGSAYLAYKKATVHDYEEYEKYKEYTPSEYELVKDTAVNEKNHEKAIDVHPNILKALKDECGPAKTEAILHIAGNNLAGQTAVLSTIAVFNINGLPHDNYNYIINLHKINDIKRLDDFLDAVNRKLSDKSYFLCCVETKDQRKKRILNKYPSLLNHIYYMFDFVIKRIMPKLKPTKGLYSLLTRDENTVISRAETLGRLSRAGFKIKQEAFISNRLFIEARKYSPPLDRNKNNYGLLIALPRIGKDGKTVNVYKLRTMHPYSEYIQDYVYSLYNLQDGGKFKHDFRITSWGAFCRKVWLDELPMFINFFKGDMKLVGIRPLSRQYFSLYKPEVQARRIRYKPGLIPPFYADMPTNIEAIQTSELKYLDAYDKHPFKTDVTYFFRSIWNIAIRKARSN